MLLNGTGAATIGRLRCKRALSSRSSHSRTCRWRQGACPGHSSRTPRKHEVPVSILGQLSNDNGLGAGKDASSGRCAHTDGSCNASARKTRGLTEHGKPDEQPRSSEFMIHLGLWNLTCCTSSRKWMLFRGLDDALKAFVWPWLLT